MEAVVGHGHGHGWATPSRPFVLSSLGVWSLGLVQSKGPNQGLGNHGLERGRTIGP